MLIRRDPAPPLAGRVTSYYGFEVETAEPVRQREGPGTDVVVILTFEEHWLIDGARHTSFVAGLHDRQVTTEHPGRSLGMQVNLDPLAARALVGVPLHELAGLAVPAEQILDPFLVERLANTPGWDARFALLDGALVPRLADARPSREVAWAWRRLRATHGRVPIGTLAAELGWSRNGSSPASATRSGCRRRRSPGSSASSGPGSSPGRCRGESSPSSAASRTSRT